MFRNLCDNREQSPVPPELPDKHLPGSGRLEFQMGHTMVCYSSRDKRIPGAGSHALIMESCRMPPWSNRPAGDQAIDPGIALASAPGWSQLLLIAVRPVLVRA